MAAMCWYNCNGILHVVIALEDPRSALVNGSYGKRSHMLKSHMWYTA